MITLLTDPLRFELAELKVDGDAYRHLFRARRLAVGEQVRVVDGQGGARWGEVARVERVAAFLSLGGPAPANEPARRVDLLAATIRPERAGWLVEKATEVGVHAIRFLRTERAPRTFGSGTIERLNRVAAAAVEQCNRARTPVVTGTHEWSEIDTLTAGLADRRFLDLSTEDAKGPKGGAAAAVKSGPTALLIGPEGGWSPAERDGLLAAGWRPLSLGPRTLRAETAAIVGLATVLGTES